MTWMKGVAEGLRVGSSVKAGFRGVSEASVVGEA
jgi:hypothetical protein